MMLLKSCTQNTSKYGKLISGHRIGKAIYISIPKKDNVKECSNYHTIALISRASKVMLKILQAGLQEYVNQGFPDVQAGFRKGRGTRDQIVNICWIIEKAKEFQENVCFCFIDCAKAFVWITTNCGELLKGWEYQIPPYLTPEKLVCRSRSNS